MRAFQYTHSHNKTQFELALVVYRMYDNVILAIFPSVCKVIFHDTSNDFIYDDHISFTKTLHVMQLLQFCMIFVEKILKKKQNFFVSVNVPNNHIFSNEMKIQSFASSYYIDKDSCGISWLTCVPVVGSTIKTYH